jgi:hypothetical protein
MVVCACNPALGRQRQEDSEETLSQKKPKKTKNPAPAKRDFIHTLGQGNMKMEVWNDMVLGKEWHIHKVEEARSGFSLRVSGESMA